MVDFKKLSFEQELTRYIKQSGDQVVVTSKVDPRRVYFLRPSSLPFCGLRRFLDHAKNGVSSERHMGATGSYYVTVGSAAHEIIQDVMARGGQVWGDWECSHCRHKLQWSTQVRCPICGSRMKYEEVEIAWKAWRGHIDGVFERKNGEFWIIDYKTAQEAKIESNKITISETYRNQQDRYVVFVEKKYGVKVKGWCLIYSSRDNMFGRHRLRSVILSEEKKEEIYQLSLSESYQHKKIWKITEISQADVLVERKLCDKRETHDKYYPWEPCPYAPQCFRKEELGVLVKEIVTAAIKGSRLPLIDKMPEPIRYELYSSQVFNKRRSIK